MSRALVVASILFCFAGVIVAQDSCSIDITYVANEGVLIDSRDARILIDGLHRKYSPNYSYLPADLQSDAEQATGQFGSIDLVLVSHVHGDHFSADAVANHLTHNPQAMLHSSKQVADSVVATGHRDRVSGVDYSTDSKKHFDSLGVSIQFVPLPHSSERFSWIENLGHLVEIGGVKILHVGDADISLRNFAKHLLVDDEIDVAIVPYWYLLDSDGRELIHEFIKPQYLIAAHISPGDSYEIASDIDSYFPEAIAFVDLMESSLTIASECPDK